MQAKKTAFPERKDGLRYDKWKIRLQYATSFQVSLAPVAGQTGDRYARLAVSVQDFVVAHINGNVCYVSAIRTASAREEYQIAGSQVRFRNGLADLGLGSGRTRQVHAVFFKDMFHEGRAIKHSCRGCGCSEFIRCSHILFTEVNDSSSCAYGCCFYRCRRCNS